MISILTIISKVSLTLKLHTYFLCPYKIKEGWCFNPSLVHSQADILVSILPHNKRVSFAAIAVIILLWKTKEYYTFKSLRLNNLKALSVNPATISYSSVIKNLLYKFSPKLSEIDLISYWNNSLSLNCFKSNTCTSLSWEIATKYFSFYNSLIIGLSILKIVLIKLKTRIGESKPLNYRYGCSFLNKGNGVYP